MKALPVIGWYGRRNSGDEAFREVHRLIFSDLPLTWLRPGSQAPFDPQVEARDDLVLVSAGDVITSFYFDWIPPNAKIIVYGAGIAWDAEFEFLGSIKERLKAVWVRNECDVVPLKNLGINAFYTPDIVFNLVPNITPIQKESVRKRAYVMLTDSKRADALRNNDLLRFTQQQNFLWQLGESLDFLAEWYQLVFVPFSFDRNDFDLAAIYDLLPRLRNAQGRDEAEIIENEMEPLEMIRFCASADIIVTTKFHGVVYSIMNEIPFVAVSDARKVRLICEENGFSDVCQPMIGANAEALKQAIVSAETPENRAKLVSVKRFLTSKAREEAHRMKSLVLGSP